MTKEFLIIFLADKIKENDEDYYKAKEFLYLYFINVKNNEIEDIEKYYKRKRYIENIKLNYKAWKEGIILC